LSITPFRDRGIVDIDQVILVISASAGMDTKSVDKYRQGINIRDPKDYSGLLSPYLSDRGFPPAARDRFDPSIEINIFGQPKLFEDPSQALRPGFSSGPGPAPFEDLAGIFNPVGYILDPGTQRYPVVLLMPNWLDPAQMDGIIEPLAIRETLINSSIGGPKVANSVKASLQPEEGPNLIGRGISITRFIPFEFYESQITPFFDSQNVIMSSDSFSVAGEGYSYEEQNQITPFDDTPEQLGGHHVKLADRIFIGPLLEPFGETFFYGGSFIDDPRFGIFGKSATSGIVYRGGDYAVRKGKTGSQWVNGTDSIAFGGLLK